MNMNTRIFFTVGVVLVATCAGCGRLHLMRGPAGRPPPAQPPVAADRAVPSAPAEKTASSGKAPVVYLRPGFILNITVLVGGKKEIEERARRISDAGTLDLPLLGTVSVKGVAAANLSAGLTELYGEFYVNPQVIVDFAKDDKTDGVSPWGFVTVLGRVKSPGRIAIPPTADLTVSGAIQRAGGFDTSARLTAIRVTLKTEGGARETREIDMNAVGTRGEVKEDIILQPDSVVYVPEQMF
jgi:protein involved in polysaccharide export with SLBB domain